jgi:hypothetical protein
MWVMRLQGKEKEKPKEGDENGTGAHYIHQHRKERKFAQLEPEPT